MLKKTPLFRPQTHSWRPILWLVLVVMAGVPLPGAQTARALSDDEQTVFESGIYAFDTQDSIGCNYPVTTNNTSPPSQRQIANAKIIIGIAKTENLSKAGAMIGLMVGLDESTLTILANPNVPISESNPAKQGDGSDHDSVGVFQQRPSTGWSTFSSSSTTDKNTVWQLMDPAYSAEAFFGTPAGAKLPAGLNNPSALEKGLQNVSGWQNQDPWVVAERVQGSKYLNGLNYKEEMPKAQALLNQLWDSAPPVPLPISMTGGAAPAGSSTNTAQCTNPAADGAASGTTAAIIQIGKDEVGKNIPYVYGGGGPDGPSGSPIPGFDCSSFMQYVFYQGAHLTLPRTAQEQYNVTVGQGHSVQQSAMQPGDLLFYGSSSTNIGHVAMYIGNNQVMEAPSTGFDLHIIPFYTNASASESLQGIGYYPPVGAPQ